MITARYLARIAVAVIVLLASERAGARLCGDDVHGRDIPCFCGDTVASDLILTNDPVTTRQCPGDALIVRVPPARDEVLIDLNGKTLRGSGRGTGIWVMSGGRDGARIVSTGAPATIEGFRDGIIGRTKGTVSLIDNVALLGHARDGARVFGDRLQIRGSQARGCGRDGFSVRGKMWVIKDTRAVGNRRDGFNVTGTAGSLGVRRGGAVAENNGRAGFNIMGISHRVADCVASACGDGIIVSGERHEINGCTASGNRGTGIKGTASFSRILNNLAERNGADGLFFRGHALQDLGGNAGYENGSLQPQPARQCEIGGALCR